MLTKIDKWKLFFSSYLPLYILLVIKDYEFFYKMTKSIFSNLLRSNYSLHKFSLYQWGLYLGVVLLTLVSIYTILRFIFAPSNKRYKVDGEFEKSGDSVISYIVTYVIPLLSMDIKSANSVLINLLLFMFIGVLYVAQELIYLNPILALLGYNFYTNGKNIVLTRFSTEELLAIQENDLTVKGNRLGSEIFIYRKLLK
ncbi:hypothetical protein P7H46_03460 [Enterococcus pseudoavium]|uniref:Uncharacterized protein n=1 Tax=Enterococcus pseudoavium TaxID=44007 RepID=A0ABU3FFT4_9ENTE|nr:MULTISPECIES: hypothetical protein [Enterococcus]MDT2604815.1 hypothetical protein [Enterococcus dongliensis]MDT2769896.1 hypothetical protein [Enterococcus pseudoavium]